MKPNEVLYFTPPTKSVLANDIFDWKH